MTPSLYACADWQDPHPWDVQAEKEEYRQQLKAAEGEIRRVKAKARDLKAKMLQGGRKEGAARPEDLGGRKEGSDPQKRNCDNHGDGGGPPVRITWDTPPDELSIERLKEPGRFPSNVGPTEEATRSSGPVKWHSGGPKTGGPTNVEPGELLASVPKAEAFKGE